jgi:putative heme transporter
MTPRRWPSAGDQAVTQPAEAPDAGLAGAVARVTAAPAGPRRRWGIAAEAAGTVAVVVGAGWAVYCEQATLCEGLRVLAAHTEPDWLAACVGMQCLSMVFFALLQQRLLKAGGARLTVSWLLSTAYLANGVAVAVPVIGSGLAATYAYHQLRERRVDPVMAQAALALAGVVSTVAFAPLVVAAALASGSPPAAASALGSALTCLIILAAGLVALRSPAGRSRLQRLASRLLSAAQRILRRPRGDPAQLTNAAVDRLSLFRLGPATVGLAFTWGLLNWAADACCLILAVKAIGAPVPWRSVLLAWSAGQGAASFSPTPGGIGVVEVAMTAALAAAGLRPADALAAVLLYRIVSFKSGLTLAWLAERAFTRHRRRGRFPADPRPDEATGARTPERPSAGPPPAVGPQALPGRPGRGSASASP